MTPYRYIQIICATAFILVFAGCVAYGWPLWYLMIPVGIFILLFSYGSYFIHSGFHLKAICKGNISSNQISITFDDGPHPEITPAILEVLREFQVKAAFFCIGYRMDQHQKLTKQIIEEGHIIGNHSWHHGWEFDFKSAHDMQVELNKTSHLLEQLIGLKTHYFRPPYGATNPNLAKAIKATNMVAIGWSLRSLDTTIKNPQKLAKRVSRRINDGDIVLFHDTQAGTVSALREFLKFCKEEGYKVVPLPELINIPAYD
ncbi:polysaccharide deacetylase family protein [soil metagenome]